MGMSSISIKNDIDEKILTKYFEFLCKKSFLVSFQFLLSVGLENSHTYRNCTKFLITLKKHKPKILRKFTFFLVNLKFEIFAGSARSKVKN